MKKTLDCLEASMMQVAYVLSGAMCGIEFGIERLANTIGQRCPRY